jgi:uncharacterized membrane protein
MNRTDRGAAFFPAFAVGLFLWIVMRHSLDPLPDRIATHFNAAGTADGWMNKETFRALMIVAAFSLAAFVIFLTWVVRFLPDAMINLPHKDHWLAPERRRETFGKLMELGFIIAGAEIVLFAFLYREIIRVNATADPQLHSIDSVWVVPLVIILAAILRFFLKMRKLPAST